MNKSHGWVESPDQRGDLRQVLLQREVAGVEQVQLVRRGGGLAGTSGDEVARALAVLAGAAAELLASPAVRKVKTCEAPGRRLLFVPAHPRRRWCDPATCGNRARVARYYQRHKDEFIEIAQQV